MDGETDREAIIRDLTREIARCRRATENISDKKALVRLSAYLGDLERALEAQMSEGIHASIHQ
jgi:CRP-like cAMP-binding protein